ncbi:MAG: DUF378 domain-containing protein [Alphaproteobacteria bacterium]
MKNLYFISLILVIVGAINWGLIAVANIDLVAQLFGNMSSLTKLVYSIVGLAGVYVAVYRFTNFTANNSHLQ